MNGILNEWLVTSEWHFVLPFPRFLCELLTFKSSLFNLRSSGSILLFIPPVRSKTTLVDSTLMVAVARIWSSLSKELCMITNVNSLKVHLKTYLFRTV